MTVAELLEQLKTCPPNMRILTVGDVYENVVAEPHIYVDKEDQKRGILSDPVGLYIGPKIDF
jgi:hypothetical protein